MKKRIDAYELSKRISVHTHFRLNTDDVLSPLKVQATFDKVAVNYVGTPIVYLLLCDSNLQVDICHIKEIHYKADGWLTIYYLTCLDYTSSLASPREITYIIECM